MAYPLADIVFNKSSLELKEYLYKNKVNINQKTKYGNTLIMNLPNNKEGSEKMIILLNAGIYIDEVDRDGKTALFLCCMKNKIKQVEILLKYRADVNIIDYIGLNAMSYTINEKIISMLFEAGSNYIFQIIY